MTGLTSRKRVYLLGLLVLATVLFVVWPLMQASGSSASSRTNPQVQSTVNVVPGVVVIKLKPGSTIPSGVLGKTSSREGQLLKAAGVLFLRNAFPAVHALSAAELSAGKVDVSKIYFARIGSGQNPLEVARQLNRSGEFEYVEPKYLNRIFDTPNDPYYATNQALYFNQMNAAAGWAITKGDTNVVIADVDGGTLWQHVDLMPNLWINKAEDANHDGKFEPIPASSGGDDDGIDNDGNGFIDDVIGWNFANNSNDPTGLPGTPGNAAHGTATASHFGAVANNSVGMTGSSWNCRLMPINVASPSSDDVIEFGYEGIQYAYANGAKIINCSWGRTGASSRFERDIINAATQAGALVVAAAGNDASISDYLPQYPANYKNVLAVGATNSGDDTRAYFSNYGLTVPVYAPGISIWSALTSGGYGSGGSGTSYSSPLVAGLAGLVKSLHPGWAPGQIAAQIRVTSDSVGTLMGHGRVNFGRALQETHAGIEILRSSILTPSGNNLFLPGDTVVLRLTVKNVLVATANNLSFAASASDPVLQALQVTTVPTALLPNDSIVVPPLLFKVGSMSASKATLLRIDWTSNGVERDAYDFRVDVFPALPLWENIQSPTFLPLTSVTAVSKNVIWTAGGNGQATAPVVLRSVDTGLTWTVATGNLTGVDLYCIGAIDSNRAWVGSADGRIFATTDGGITWPTQTYPAPQSPFIDGVKIFPNLTGYALGDPTAGGRFVVLSTSNGGQTWTHLANEPVGLADEAGWNNSFCWTDQNHGWFGTNKHRIWRTTDGGTTWIAGTTPDSGSVAVSFADSARGFSGYLDGSLAVTNNGGVTWTALASPTSRAVTGLSLVAGAPFAWVTDPLAPYFSSNNGGTWETQTTWPLAGSLMHITFYDTTAGWMVSSFGEVLRYRGNGGITPAPIPPPLPVSYVLEQNFPNPFNPSTTIRFAVPSKSRVKVTIYNILGQTIVELVNDEFQVGSYDRVWKGTVASGIYFCRLEAVGLDNGGKKFVDVKKMVLLK